MLPLAFYHANKVCSVTAQGTFTDAPGIVRTRVVNITYERDDLAARKLSVGCYSQRDVWPLKE